ncbi:MAG: hypothetical protein AAF570_07925 [Bacteroidota bacterium]
MLKALEDFRDQLTWTEEPTPKGWLRRLHWPHMLSHSAQITGPDGRFWQSMKIYRAQGGYTPLYVRMSPEGELEHAYGETIGVNPDIFFPPGGTPWTSLTPTDEYHKREVELYLPIQNREGVARPKHFRPFVGDYIGNVGNFAMFHSYPFFGGKQPDKLCKAEFKDGVYKKRKTAKLELPFKNKVFLDAEERIHLLGRQEDGFFLHREVDVDGKVLRSRPLQLGLVGVGVCRLDFEGDSAFVTYSGRDLRYVRANAAGELEVQDLFALREGSRFFSLWDPVHLGGETYVVRFTHEDGNGWVKIVEGKCMEIWLRDDEGYKAQKSGTHITMPSGAKTITGMSGLKDGRYAVAMTDAQPPKGNLCDLWILGIA